MATTSGGAAVHLVFLLLLSFTLRPLSSTPQPRRILHQPLLPADPSPPPAPSPPAYPFTTSAPNNSPFFQSYPSPPAPASFPANISSITVPGATKPNSTSSKLIIAAIAAVVAAITVVSLAVFLHLRHRATSRRSSSSFNQSKPLNSDTSSAVSFSQAPNTQHIPKLIRPSQSSSEFLYLGTLVNSHAPAPTTTAGAAARTIYTSAANSRKLDSPELRPLPPLNTQSLNLGNNAEVIPNKDDESEEFYSPKGSINGGRDSSIGAGSASTRALAAVQVDDFNGSTSNSSSTYSSSPVRSASFSLSPANNRIPLNSIPKTPDLIEIQTVAPLPEARVSMLQESVSPTQSLPSSSSPESHSKRSDELSPRNSSVLDQNLEIYSPTNHNSTAIPEPPETRDSAACASPSPVTSSSPRNSNASDRNVESPARSNSSVQLQPHNANNIPPSPELEEFATSPSLPVRDSSLLQFTLPTPPEIQGVVVVPESASPLPPPEISPANSAESSPRKSNVSDQLAESPKSSSSAQQNAEEIKRSEGSSPSYSHISDHTEAPVGISSSEQHNSTAVPTATAIEALVLPESSSLPCSPGPNLSSEESLPRNSNMESPVGIINHNSDAIPASPNTEALLSPMHSKASDQNMGISSTAKHNYDETPAPPVPESPSSLPRISNASDQDVESSVMPELFLSSPERMPVFSEQNLSSLVRISNSEQHKPPSPSQLPERESQESTSRSLNDSDHNMESPSSNGSTSIAPPPPPPFIPFFLPSLPSPAQPISLNTPPPVSTPPPPPPPPPQRLSPRTPTPPPKTPLQAPPLINPLRPIGFENPTLISPMQLPSGDSAHDELNPKPKLKPLHWDKVRASSDREMVWDQIKSSSFKLNEEMIETLFLVNTPKPNPNEPTRWHVLPPPGLDNGDKVLDPKKSQNIAILLKALHVTVDEVCEGLLEGNTEILGAEFLESLMKMAPSKEEERRLKEYRNDSPVKLGPAERFLKAVLDIPHAFKRVEALLYASNFESEVDYLKHSFATLEAACEELRTSKMFLKLLEAVLKTGNRMNVGTNRGDAHAFKLDTLLKLVDVKGADGKTTLLHFVVQEIIRSDDARLSGEQHASEDTSSDAKCRKLGLQVVSALGSELSNVKKAAVMDAEVLSTYVSKLAKGITNVNEILKLNLEEGGSSSSRFTESMISFMNNAEEEIFKIQAQERLGLSLVKEITEYFHGNSAMEEPHPFRIFTVVRDFLAVLDRVCKEVGMINERTIVSSAHKFPVPVNPMLHQATGTFQRRQHTSSDAV